MKKTGLYYIILIIGSVLFSPANAQLEKLITRDTTSTNIIKLDTLIAIKFEINNDVKFFDLESRGTHYDIRPNNKTALKLAASYRDITFSLQFSPPFLANNNDSDLKGKTRNFNFSLAFNRPDWIHDINFFRTKGYFLNNSKAYVQTPNTFIKFPEMVYRGVEGYSGFKFNRNFSLKAINTLSERQKGNAGSFIPAIYYSYYVLKNVEFPENTISQKSNNFELAVSPGYYHTIILQHDYYFSIGLKPAMGLVTSKLKTYTEDGTTKDRDFSPLFRFDTQLAFGYNGDKYFAGVDLVTSSSSYKRNLSSSKTTKNSAFIRVFGGFRIHEIKKVKELYRKYIPE